MHHHSRRGNPEKSEWEKEEEFKLLYLMTMSNYGNFTELQIASLDAATTEREVFFLAVEMFGEFADDCLLVL